jgi:hypothetical protein
LKFKDSLDDGGRVEVGVHIRMLDTEELTIDQADGVATDFVRVAMWKEAGLDVGAFGPFPEEGFEGIAAFGLFEGEALLFEVDALGAEVAATQRKDVGEELAYLAEFGFGVFGDGGVMGGGGETQGNPMDELADNRFSGDLLLGWRREVSLGFGRELERGLADFPFSKGVPAVFGEVLFADGFVVETVFEDGLEFGERVEPREQGPGRFGVSEPEVEMLAKREGETGEFAGHRRDWVA